MCKKEGLFRFLFFPKFQAKKEDQAATVSPDFSPFVSSKCWEVPLKLRGDDNKNRTRRWRREDGRRRKRVWSDCIFFYVASQPKQEVVNLI